MFPTIAEYNQVIQSKGGNAFRSLPNLSFVAARTSPVKIYSYGSGSYAVVFKAKNEHNEYAIRCFISAEQENINRYKSIDNYLKGIDASWVTNVELLENEIDVKGSFYPVIKMEWIEGQLLNNFVSQILKDNQSLSDLQKEVVDVSHSLEANGVGHGDIQCGNIIIIKSDNSKPIIKLIDYDGMYIPAFSNETNLERGRAEFQHPNRSDAAYNEKIDRFSFWVILCALEALIYDKSLWLEVMQGGFNTLDNMLFVGDDFQHFNSSKLVKRLYDLNHPSLTYYLDKLNKFCNTAPSEIDPLSLFDTNTNKEGNYVSHVSTRSDAETLKITSTPTGAVVLLSPDFNRIGTTPLSLEKSQFVSKTLIISYLTQIKKIEINDFARDIDVSFEVKPVISTNNSPTYKPSSQTNTTTNTSTVTSASSASIPIVNESDNSTWKVLGILFIILSAVLLIIAISNYNEVKQLKYQISNTENDRDILQNQISGSENAKSSLQNQVTILRSQIESIGEVFPVRIQEVTLNKTIRNDAIELTPEVQYSSNLLKSKDVRFYYKIFYPNSNLVTGDSDWLFKGVYSWYGDVSVESDFAKDIKASLGSFTSTSWAPGTYRIEIWIGGLLFGIGEYVHY